MRARLFEPFALTRRFAAPSPQRERDFTKDRSPPLQQTSGRQDTADGFAGTEILPGLAPSPSSDENGAGKTGSKPESSNEKDPWPFTHSANGLLHPRECAQCYEP